MVSNRSLIVLHAILRASFNMRAHIQLSLKVGAEDTLQEQNCRNRNKISPLRNQTQWRVGKAYKVG